MLLHKHSHAWGTEEEREADVRGRARQRVLYPIDGVMFPAMSREIFPFMESPHHV